MKIRLMLHWKCKVIRRRKLPRLIPAPIMQEIFKEPTTKYPRVYPRPPDPARKPTPLHHPTPPIDTHPQEPWSSLPQTHPPIQPRSPALHSPHLPQPSTSPSPHLSLSSTTLHSSASRVRKPCATSARRTNRHRRARSRTLLGGRARGAAEAGVVAEGEAVR